MQLTFLGLEQDFLAVDAHMQERVFAVQSDCSKEFLLACSYKPTITLGLRSNAHREVRVSQNVLAARGISCVPVKRGGQATFQGPGQLALYPIRHLPSRGKSLRSHILDLEQATHAVIRQYGGGRAIGRGVGPGNTGVGVWVGGVKVGFIGVRIQRGVTSYGLNLNIRDCGEFDLINPCGQADMAVGSLESVLGVALDLRELAEQWAKAFAG